MKYAYAYMTISIVYLIEFNMTD